MSPPTDKILPGSVAINGRNLRNTSRRAEDAAASRLDFKCVICMEVYIQKRPTAGRCGHVFCSVCLTQMAWMFRGCPLCRTPILMNELFDIAMG